VLEYAQRAPGGKSGPCDTAISTSSSGVQVLSGFVAKSSSKTSSFA